MSKAWDEMSERERDALVAGAMGWTQIKMSDIFPDSVRGYAPGAKTEYEVPAYTDEDDRNPSKWVEDEIERRGLQSDYGGALAEIAGVSDDFWYDATGDDVWKIAHVAPADRCRAALRAMGVEV